MKQRTSTRQVKLSKAFRVVDEDTRRSAREQRLLALEADNYNESELTGDREDDAFDSDVSLLSFLPIKAIFEQDASVGLRCSEEKESQINEKRRYP